MDPTTHVGKSVLIAWLGTLLMVVAGYVDVVGYLRYLHIFAANMSGNHIRLGIALQKWDTGEMLVRALPILAFAAGAIASELLMRVARRAYRLRAAAWIWVAEALLITAVALGDRFLAPVNGWRDLLLLSILAGGMGMQNTSLRRTGALTIFTTHVTGALTSASIRLADLLLAFLERFRQRRRHRSPAHKRHWQTTWLLSLPVVYIAGAAAGAAALDHMGILCLVLPAALLFILAVATYLSAPAASHA